MENNENLNNQVDTKEKKKSNKAIGIVVLVISLLLLGFAGYKLFMEKPNNSEPKDDNIQEQESNEENEPLNDNPNRILITEKDTMIDFNGKKIQIRFADGYLYIDNQKKGPIENVVSAVYVSDNFILLEASAQNHYHPYAINKNYELIKVNGGPDTVTCAIYDINVEKNKVTATEGCYDITGEKDDYSFGVEFVYEGKQITIKKIENNNTKTNNNKNIDLLQIATKSFKVRNFNPEKLETIQGEKSFELYIEDTPKLTINVNDTKATITFKSDVKEFDNVSKVYYSNYGNCAQHILIYIFSNDKLYLIDSDSIYENIVVKEIDNSKKYDSIYMDYLHPATCDFYPLWLGRTTDGKYYDLATAIEYKENTYFYYDDGNNYIKNDKTYKLGKNSGKIKIAFIDVVEEKLRSYVDENDYLYEFDRDISEYKLVSNAKITKVEKQGKNYNFIFSNGNKKELEMEYLEVYK